MLCFYTLKNSYALRTSLLHSDIQQPHRQEAAIPQEDVIMMPLMAREANRLGKAFNLNQRTDYTSQDRNGVKSTHDSTTFE